ncbi:hypothetical protein AVEN_40580-1 [Araneus ventricosus]|uniref:Uncharacterized protein n=1 Tax=Araneus ventricosus TaxID=182803 RepID=A0A4Y2VGB2_ARAVE|nr:hypothetical protein AVEN_40580-1 [Araneus ventricosus]
MSPLWTLLSDGCVMHRDVARTIQGAGFSDVTCDELVFKLIECYNIEEIRRQMTFLIYFYTILKATSNQHAKQKKWQQEKCKSSQNSVPSRSQHSRTKKQKGEKGRNMIPEREKLLLHPP